MCIKNIEKIFDVEKYIFNIVEGNHIPILTNPSINNKAQFSTELFLFHENGRLSTFPQILKHVYAKVNDRIRKIRTGSERQDLPY
jgi:hypothetical protein